MNQQLSNTIDSEPLSDHESVEEIRKRIKDSAKAIREMKRLVTEASAATKELAQTIAHLFDTMDHHLNAFPDRELLEIPGQINNLLNELRKPSPALSAEHAERLCYACAFLRLQVCHIELSLSRQKASNELSAEKAS